VPRGMALLGLIGGPLAFAGVTAVLFGLFEQPSAPFVVPPDPEILWEASLALYLTLKGLGPPRSSSGMRDPLSDLADDRGVTQATPTTTLALAWPCSR
jgi:hypothetical protein